MNIQNHFSDAALLSLAELKARLEQDSKLDARKQREMISAINTTAKWLNLPAEMIPASATFLRGKFQGIHPAHHHVTKRRVQNIKSLILSAMRSQGLSTKLASYLAEMSPPWLRLWDIIEGEQYYRTEFSRFFRYCSKQRIAPSEINDQVLADYLQALEAESFVKTPKVRQQSICRLWNKCTELYQSQGWPQIKLVVPCYETRRYTLDSDQLPPVFLRELNTYLTSLSGTDPFNMQVKAFRPRSIKTIEGHFKRYISALHYQGVDLSGITSLEAIVTKEMFQLAMRWFWNRNGGKTSKHTGEIAWSIRCYATKHLTADEETIAFYAGAMKRLRVSQDGLSDKNQRAMAQFDEPKTIEALVGLPIKLWAKAERSHKTASTKRRSKELQLCVQTAIAIEVLTFAPMRISNLQNLRIDQHISWQNKHAVIHIPRAQVKNDIDLAFKLPISLSQRMQTYIRDWRTLYTEGANLYLFPGRKLNPKDGTRLRRQISNTLWDETGIKLTPHQFRHAAAKILLDAKPGHYEVVRKILGHKNLTTTYSHYAGAETQAALELYDDIILEHRKGTSFGSTQRKGTFQEPPFMDPLQIYGGKK
jgi:integrase